MRLRTWALCGTGTLVSVHLQRSNGVAPASSLVWVQALATCGNALWSLAGSWEATNKTLNAIFKRTTASTSSKHTEMAQRVSSFHKCRSQASDALQFEPWPWHASAGTALFPECPCQAADPLPELLLSMIPFQVATAFDSQIELTTIDSIAGGVQRVVVDDAPVEATVKNAASCNALRRAQPIPFRGDQAILSFDAQLKFIAVSGCRRVVCARFRVI
jgi:hypothetical protein